MNENPEDSGEFQEDIIQEITALATVQEATSIQQIQLQWRIQTRRLWGQSYGGRQIFTCLIPQIFYDNRWILHKNWLPYEGQGSGYFCWFNYSIFQEITSLKEP